MAPDECGRVRIDVWLDVACLFRTRSEAQKACALGRVDVNGQPAKPHRPIQPGDEVLISRPFGRKQTIVVRAIADRHLPKPEARELYEDRTPPLSAEDVEMRRLERLYRATSRSRHTPDKRERRELRRFKGR